MWPFKKKDLEFYETKKEKHTIESLGKYAKQAGEIIERLRSDSRSEAEFEAKYKLFLELAGKNLRYADEEKKLELEGKKVTLAKEYVALAKTLDPETLATMRSFNVKTLEHKESKEE